MKIFGVGSSRRSGGKPPEVFSDAVPAPAVDASPAVVTSGTSLPACVSDAGRRCIARFSRDSPVDLKLETPTLRTAADVPAVIAAAGAGVKTLSLGPWGDEEAEPGAPASDPADMALQALAEAASSWNSWPLRGVSVCELKLADASPLPSILRALPVDIRAVRLSRIGLGRSGRYADCLSALESRGFDGSIQLDLSGNGLSDGDVDSLLPLLSDRPAVSAPCDDDPMSEVAGIRPPVVSRLNIGCNSQITATGLTRLLAPEFRLQALDLSECTLGPAGAQLLANFLLLPSSQVEELVAYRTGLGSDGLRALLASGVRSPKLRSLNVVANGQHSSDWPAAIGDTVARALAVPTALRVLTLSCPEKEIVIAEKLFANLPARVILVPNEQNNYNRAMFLGE